MYEKLCEKQDAHSLTRELVSPSGACDSTSSLQKQVGHAIVQLPQLRQCAATSSHRGCSRLRCSMSGRPLVSMCRPMRSTATSVTACAASSSCLDAGAAESESS